MLYIKLTLLFLISLIISAQTKLNKKVSLLDGKVEIKVPGILTEMKGDMYSFKYHTLPRPQLVLTDENAEVNLLGNTTQQPVNESQLMSYKDFSEKTLKKRPDIEILEDGVKPVNGKKIAFIKFISQASDQKVFNFYFFTSVQGKLLFFSFNCPQKLQNTWEGTAFEILNSLKIN